MSNSEFISRLEEYRFVKDIDKINLSNFFQYFELDDSISLTDRKNILKYQGYRYETSIAEKTILNRLFIIESFDFNLSFFSVSDSEYSEFSFFRSDEDVPLIFTEFHYIFCDESGYYSYILRNNMLYFRYLGVDRKDSVPFEKWKYNYEVNEEGKMKEIVPDIDVSLSLGNMSKVVYDIYQDPKIGFRFMKEVNTQ